MAGHLEVLMSIFPGKIFLDVEDIAKCLGQSKGHIYNLSSTKKLPFQLEWGLGDKIQVSIVEMAKYLDSKIQVQEPQAAPALVNPVVVPAKKLGRPRGSTKTKIQLAFQSQLQVAIFKHEFRLIMDTVGRSLEEIEFDSSEEVACADKFDSLKLKAGSLLYQARAYMNESFLNTIAPIKPIEPRKKRTF